MNAPWTEDTIQGVLNANRIREDDGRFLTLLDGDGRPRGFTYEDMLRRSEVWAATLHRRGIVAGERVVVILPHSLDLYAAYLGAMLLGAVPAMFAHPSPKLSEAVYFETIEALLRSSRARAVITYQDLAAKLRPAIRTIEGMDAVLTLSDTEIGDDRTFPVPLVQPDDPAFLQYSSGTTGLKKGVVISHRALLWQVRTYGNCIRANGDDCIVSWLPLYHDMGLICCLFLPVILRCRLVALSPFDWVKRPGLWAEAVSRYNGTLSWLPNFAYPFMAKNVPDGAYDLSSLRGVVNCSEPVTQAAHQAFLDRFSASGFKPEALAASYAMAETTFAATSGGFNAPLNVIEHEGRTLVSSGAALPETGISILDENGAPLPDGQTGEIALQSPSMFGAYDGNEKATRAALRDGRYLSGDLGFLEDGHLFVTGRKRDLIILGGKNIYPHDIEALAEGVEGILPGRSVALGEDDPATGTQRLVVLAESDNDEADLLAAAIRQRIAETTEIAPGDVRVVPPRWLRKSTSGKIARKANLERYQRLLKPSAPCGAPAAGGSDVDIIRRVVGDILPGGSSLDADESLIRSGRIDSFSVVNLILGLEQGFALRLPEQIVGDPDALDTIRAISRTIERLRDGPTQEAVIDFGLDDVPMRTGDPVALPKGRAGFWTWYYRLTFRRLGIRYGKGLRVLGPLLLRLDGAARNLSFGRGVTLMPWADLKVRENGQIRIGDGCAIDTMARLVAANDAAIRLGDRAQIAFSSIINAGADVTIGRDTATAGHCTIIASEHRYDGTEPIMRQGYRHEPVLIGADVWLASNVLVTPGAKIGNGAVIAARSTVTGTIRPYALASGVPARVIGSRGR